MRRGDEYSEKMREVLREQAAQVETVGHETDVPWGGFRATNAPPAPTTAAPTMAEWIDRMKQAMFDDHLDQLGERIAYIPHPRVNG